MRDTVNTADTMRTNKHLKIKHACMQYTETRDDHYTWFVSA